MAEFVPLKRYPRGHAKAGQFIPREKKVEYLGRAASHETPKAWIDELTDDLDIPAFLRKKLPPSSAVEMKLDDIVMPPLKPYPWRVALVMVLIALLSGPILLLLLYWAVNVYVAIADFYIPNLIASWPDVGKSIGEFLLYLIDAE